MSTSASTTIISATVSSNDFSHNNRVGQLTQVSEMQAATAVIAEATSSSDKSIGNNSISTQSRAMSCMCFPFPRSSQVYSFWRTLETPRTMKNHNVFEVFQRMTKKTHFLTCNFLMCLLHFWLVRSDFLMGLLHFHFLFFLRCQSAF